MRIKREETKQSTFSSKQKNTFTFCVSVLQRDFQLSQFREFLLSQQRSARARKERHQEETRRRSSFISELVVVVNYNTDK